MSTPRFIHLRTHSEYSLCDGLLRVPQLVQRCRELDMPAVAITDECNLFATIKFYRQALAAGIKPIIGADLKIANADPQKPPTRCTLLCQNDVGYRNLTRLVTRAYLQGQERGEPLLQGHWLEGHCDGLIALSGAHEGEIGQLLMAGKHAQATQALQRWLQLFPQRYYLEVQRLGRSHDEAHVEAAVRLALDHGVPLVATNDVRFAASTDFDAHEARVCIHDGYVLGDPRRNKRYSANQYLRSSEEMAELFADLPEALENTVEIAQRCTQNFTLGRNYLPDFPVPPGHDAASFLAEEARRGLEQRITQLQARQGLSATRQAYDERLEVELGVINQMGFPGYFLIVADFIRWARNNAVPVGPGRGSGAGSLVAYALGITDLDPLAYDLLFERFLNPERVSMPDFDIDFCMEGRDRVIDYVAERYGKGHVSQIITYGSMAARAVLRDVGRVLGHPYGMVDRIAKLVPGGAQNLGITLDKALETAPELKAIYQDDEEVHYLIDTALQLEGLARNAGKHAGGVVIAPSELTDFTPLYCEAGGEHVVTQFDKDDVEAVGLVKFDFLGLRTLTIIDWTVKNIHARSNERIDISAIPLDDKPSFDLLKSAETTAVFQLESAGMRRIIRDLKPDNFEDIVALVALYRPGPLESGMVVDFIKRKHGEQRVEYPHPKLEPVLKPTYGVIVYQEQVMQIAQVLAGYTLGGADLLRRAMGKKKKEEMDKQRAIFVEGSVARDVDGNVAGAIFDLVEKFAGYGFNKSHSAAYALVSYQTAWLKAHYPADFMSAVLSADMASTDKVVTMIDECRRLQLEVRPPDVNTSVYAFSVVNAQQIRYGLGAIKGVGEAAINALVEEREQGGRFSDLFDFCRRVDLRRLNRRTLEALLMAGALDELGPNRASLMEGLEVAIKAADHLGAAADAGQTDLFGGAAAQPETRLTLSELKPWPDSRRLAAEKETLGLYLTGHPIDAFLPELNQFTSGRLAQLGAEEDRKPRKVIVAGLLVDLRRFGNRSLLMLDDRSGRMECTLFEQATLKYAAFLNKDALCIVQGSLAWDDYADCQRIRVEEVLDLAAARARFARRLLLRPQAGQQGRVDAAQLEALLQPYLDAQGCPVSLAYRNARAQAWLHLGEQWKVRLDDALLARLREQWGATAVAIRYAHAAQAQSRAA